MGAFLSSLSRLFHDKVSNLSLIYSLICVFLLISLVLGVAMIPQSVVSWLFLGEISFDGWRASTYAPVSLLVLCFGLWTIRVLILCVSSGLPRNQIGSTFFRVRLPSLIVFLVTPVVMGLGFVLLVIPGIMVLVRWSLAVPLMIHRQISARNAIKQSKTLTSQHVLPLAVLYLGGGAVRSSLTGVIFVRILPMMGDNDPLILLVLRSVWIVVCMIIAASFLHAIYEVIIDPVYEKKDNTDQIVLTSEDERHYRQSRIFLLVGCFCLFLMITARSLLSLFLQIVFESDAISFMQGLEKSSSKVIIVAFFVTYMLVYSRYKIIYYALLLWTVILIGLQVVYAMTWVQSVVIGWKALLPLLFAFCSFLCFALPRSWRYIHARVGLPELSLGKGILFVLSGIFVIVVGSSFLMTFTVYSPMQEEVRDYVTINKSLLAYQKVGGTGAFGSGLSLRTDEGRRELDATITAMQQSTRFRKSLAGLVSSVSSRDLVLDDEVMKQIEKDADLARGLWEEYMVIMQSSLENPVSNVLGRPWGCTTRQMLGIYKQMADADIALRMSNISLYRFLRDRRGQWEVATSGDDVVRDDDQPSQQFLSLNQDNDRLFIVYEKAVDTVNEKIAKCQ